MKRPSNGPEGPADAQKLPDFLAELQGDPWIELRWKRGLASRFRNLARSGDGGGEDRVRGGRFAYQLSDSQRIGNAIGAPQAMVKIVRKGGASSRSDLVSQLSYLSREGELVLEEHDPADGGFPVDGREDIRSVADAWAGRWDTAARYDGRSARAGSQTYHVVVSFPSGTDAEIARGAADLFAERFLTSGEFGDAWRHVRAWHTDTEHPHMHLVIDRRGVSGAMMQIHPAKDINPQRLRALQVETAAEYGILLNDTPRVSRGLTGPALSTEEWRAAERGEPLDRLDYRQAYADLAAGFAREIVPLEAAEAKRLGQRVAAQAGFAHQPDHLMPVFQNFVAALAAASHSLSNEEEPDLNATMTDTRTNDDDAITLEALQRMNPDELSRAMRGAVKEAEQLAPRIADEAKRAALEAETGRIRQLFAGQIPEFRPAIDQRDREGGLEPIVQSRGSAEETRERVGKENAERLQRDGIDADRSDYEDRPAILRDPSKTLDQADQRIRDAYVLRGMNGDRALARIKAGLDATAETRNRWHEQEIAERMTAGDLSRSEAEKDVAELHAYAAKTYRASERAMQRGVSLDATETYAPEDPMVVRRREERLAKKRGIDAPERRSSFEVPGGHTIEREVWSRRQNTAESFPELDTYLAAANEAQQIGDPRKGDRDAFHAAGAAGMKEVEALDALADAAADNPDLYKAAMALDRPLVRDALVIGKYGDDGKEAVRLNERISDNLVSGETDTPQHHQLMREAKASLTRSPALREFDDMPDLVKAHEDAYPEAAKEQNRIERDGHSDHASRDAKKTPDKRISEEELRQRLQTREREMTEADRQRDAERGVDRNAQRDRGLGLTD